MLAAVTLRRASSIRRVAVLLALAMPAALLAPLTLAQTATPPAARRAVTRQVVGATVEVKGGETWRRGTVKNNSRNTWYLVAFEGGTQEWVEPWRVRTPGSDYEIGTVTSNPPVTTNNKGEVGPPPRVTPGPPPTENSDAMAPLPVSWPIATVDLAAAPESTPAVAGAKWSYQPAAVDAAAKLRDATMPLLGGVQTDGSDTPITFEPSGSVVLVGYQSRSEAKLPVAEIVDLSGGKLIARAELNPASRPMSASPDGKRLVCRAEGTFPGTMTRVDVWDVEGRAAPKQVVSFSPYAGENAKDVERAIALDADRVLTNNRDGHVIVWRIAAGTAKPIWRAKFGEGALAVSPDHRTIATISKGAMLFLNADDGKVVGAIETGARSLTAMSFRGDGKRLSALAGPTLYEYDLEAGKQIASIGLPVNGTDVRHLSGDAVWVTGALKSAVYDVAGKTVLTQYTLFGAERTAIVGDRLVALLRSGGRWSLASWALAPKPPATPVAMPTVPAGAVTRATIEIAIEIDEFAKRAVVDSLRKQVAARGWTLVEVGQPASVHIQARLEDGKPEPKVYEWMGKREVVDVTPSLTKLSIDVDGRSAWAATMASNAVATPGTDKAQTAEAVKEAARRPNVAFLKNTVLPETLFQPMETLPATVPQVTLKPGPVKEN